MSARPRATIAYFAWLSKRTLLELMPRYLARRCASVCELCPDSTDSQNRALETSCVVLTWIARGASVAAQGLAPRSLTGRRCQQEASIQIGTSERAHAQAAVFHQGKGNGILSPPQKPLGPVNGVKRPKSSATRLAVAVVDPTAEHQPGYDLGAQAVRGG